MPKCRHILLLLAAGVLTAGIFFAARSREPAYGGRSLSRWLEAFENWPYIDSFPVWARKPSLPAHEEAKEAIRHMGTNGITYLVEYIRQKEHGSWWVNGPRELRAQRALIALGPDANAAIPELVRMMNDPKAPQTATAAAATLTALGTKEALPFALAALTNQMHPCREIVALNMGAMGTNARPAIPALVECLLDQNPTTLSAAIGSLSQLKLEPALCVPALAATLKTSDPYLRLKSVHALEGFSSEARSAAPQLLASLQDPEKSVRRAATNALRAIAPEALTNAPPK